MAIYNHTGQVVTDLERSKRFYCELFGFEPWYEITPPDEGSSQLLQLTPPLGSTVVYLVLDGFVLELMHYSAPGVTAPFQPRAMNDPGLTHLSFSVDDVRVTAAKAVELGGEIIDATDIGNALFIRDPDGQLVELLPTGYVGSRPPKP